MPRRGTVSTPKPVAPVNPVPARKLTSFMPLKQWPFVPHVRQAELDAYRAMPSAQKDA